MSYIFDHYYWIFYNYSKVTNESLILFISLTTIIMTYIKSKL